MRDLAIWDKDSKEARYVRTLGRKTPQTFEDYREFVETRPPEVIANIALCLIHQTNYLIDQQLRRLERDFLREGGLRERMTRLRVQHRKRNPGPHDSHASHDSHNSHPPKGQGPAEGGDVQ